MVEALRSFIRGSFISEARAACLSGCRGEKCGVGTYMLIGQEKAPHVHSFSICENSTCGHTCERLEIKSSRGPREEGAAGVWVLVDSGQLPTGDPLVTPFWGLASHTELLAHSDL